MTLYVGMLQYSIDRMMIFGDLFCAKYIVNTRKDYKHKLQSNATNSVSGQYSAKKFEHLIFTI